MMTMIHALLKQWGWPGSNANLWPCTIARCCCAVKLTKSFRRSKNKPSCQQGSFGKLEYNCFFCNKWYLPIPINCFCLFCKADIATNKTPINLKTVFQDKARTLFKLDAEHIKRALLIKYLITLSFYKEDLDFRFRF